MTDSLSKYLVSVPSIHRSGGDRKSLELTSSVRLWLFLGRSLRSWTTWHPDFRRWAEMRQRLLDLHIEFESVEAYPLERQNQEGLI